MDYSSLRLPIIEARVDWLTCTTKRGPRMDALLWHADDVAIANEQKGDKLEEWHAMGYMGFQCGHVRFGRGTNGGIAIFSGECAHEHAGVLAGLADHWTRIDYAVTALDRARVIDPSEDYWQQWEDTKGRGRIIAALERHQNKQGGNTLTLGSRQSAYYTRVYDKHRESRGDYPPGSWRWETELKRHASEQHQRHWQEHRMDGKAIAGLIQREFARLHLSVPWDEEPDIDRTPRIKHARDADRVIEWLTAQVRPSVEFAVEAPGREPVLRALNLPSRFIGG